MAADNIIELVQTLTEEDQQSVREFVAILKRRAPSSQSPFQAAVDEFIHQHPDLLQRLAQ